MSAPADRPEPQEPAETSIDSRIRWARRGVWVVLLLGVVSFLVRGADNPDDPSLGSADVAAGARSRVSTDDPAAPTTSTSAVAPDSGGSSTTSAPGSTPPSGSDSGPPAGRSAATPPAMDPGPTPTVLVPAPVPGPGPAPTPVGNPDRRPLEGFAEVVFRVTAPGGGTYDGMAMLADTPATRRQGLMEQTDLRGYDGMIFRFQSANTGGFWMRNTLIPLSIAFFDVNGRFLSSADMEPCPPEPADCPSTGPGVPYFHAIEVAKGDLGRLGIGPGSVLSFP